MSSVEIVLTGTELLLGEIVDTTSVMVAKMLHEIGLDMYYKTIVGDNEDRITEVLQIALSRVDFVIVSGGLGPTVDDRTRQAAAAAANRELVYSTELEEQIAARFRNFGREMAENNKRQAWIPEGAIPVENPVGTAPCFIVEDEQGTIICLPGVPRELKYQMENAIMPYLKERVGQTQLLKVRNIRTCTLGESTIDNIIDDLMRLTNPTVGLAAHLGQVDIRITAKAGTAAEADRLIEPVEAEVRRRLGDHIFGVDDDTLPGVVGGLLKQHGVQVALLDTMTGGVVGQQLSEAGFADQIASQATFDQLGEGLAMVELTEPMLQNDPDGKIGTVAQTLSQANTIGACLVGPIDGGEAGPLAFVGLAYQDRVEVKQFRMAAGRRSRQPWLIAQTFDLIWRQLRGW